MNCIIFNQINYTHIATAIWANSSTANMHTWLLEKISHQWLVFIRAYSCEYTVCIVADETFKRHESRLWKI